MLERRCRRCGLEMLKEGEVGTFYPGKRWCVCNAKGFNSLGKESPPLEEGVVYARVSGKAHEL